MVLAAMTSKIFYWKRYLCATNAPPAFLAVGIPSLPLNSSVQKRSSISILLCFIISIRKDVDSDERRGTLTIKPLPHTHAQDIANLLLALKLAPL